MSRNLPDSVLKKSVEIARIEKVIDSELSWKDESGNKNYKKTNFVPVKNKIDKATIRNLFFMAAYKKSRIIDECEYSFALFYMENNTRYPILQLEVYGQFQQSHRSSEFSEIFFGPHLHFYNTQIELEEELGCNDFQEWVSLYCHIAKIELKIEIKTPF
ncbi:hypothetical protein [Thioflexithrix psekupsensis]|uniref:Uncharacterized protein n=1 Tax=Thioflexithrix psekupsensis TaxID=1570016 RepID=A0A251XCE2_9GAMM|nr:hypothetical protein [Thioflexithrix psekupsensis]OUD16026.1 hypothetical protein TPSD3_01080 [Thioflexithrix psekupsensis]